MSLDAEIDALRAALPECSLVAFGDAGTRLMLRASHQEAFQREYLDALCALAANCFDMQDAAPGGGENEGQDQPCEAFVLTPANTRVFVKSGSGSDFLCCVCEAPDNARQAADAAAKTLAGILERY